MECCNNRHRLQQKCCKEKMDRRNDDASDKNTIRTTETEDINEHHEKYFGHSGNLPSAQIDKIEPNDDSSTTGDLYIDISSLSDGEIEEEDERETLGRKREHSPNGTEVPPPKGTRQASPNKSIV